MKAKLAGQVGLTIEEPRQEMSKSQMVCPLCGLFYILFQTPKDKQKRVIVETVDSALEYCT